MSKRRSSLKARAFGSFLKISQACYDLTFPALPQYPPPLLCQTQLITRTAKKVPQDTTLYTSRKVRTARSSHRGHRAQSSSFLTMFAQGQNEKEKVPQSDILQRVYKVRARQMQSPAIKKQQQIFTSKLVKAFQGDTLNAANLQIGPLSLKQICKSLNLASIKVLVLDNNALKDQGVCMLAQIVTKMQLNCLSLASVGISHKGCRTLLQNLSTVKSLQQLNLSSDSTFSRNKIQLNALQHVSCVLGLNQCNVKVLKLNKVGLNDINFTFLCNSLGKNCNLKHLQVAHNLITKKSMQIFKEKAIKQQLQCLDISDNKIIGGGLHQLTDLICSKHGISKISKTLKILRIIKAHVSPSSFFAFFSNNSNQIIQQLRISDNAVGGSACFSAFHSFISRNVALKILDLAKTQLNTANFMQLSASLQHNSTLQTLILSHNMMQLVDLKHVLATVGHLKCLKRLDLNDCSIVDSSIIGCQTQLMHLKHLQELNLQQNFIAAQGAGILQRMLFKNSQLVKVRVQHNSMGVRLMKLIQQAANKNTQKHKIEQMNMDYYDYVQASQKNYKESLKMQIEQLKNKEKMFMEKAAQRMIKQQSQVIARMEKELGLAKTLKYSQKQIQSSKDTLANTQKHPQ